MRARKGYSSLAQRDLLTLLILCPALNRDDLTAIIAGSALPDDTATGEGIAQAHHAGKTYLEMGEKGVGVISDLLGDELSQEGHTEHAMSDHAIQADATSGLGIKMDGVMIARRVGVASKLLLANRRLDEWRQHIAAGGGKNIHRCTSYLAPFVGQPLIGAARSRGCSPPSGPRAYYKTGVRGFLFSFLNVP